jgi:CheY-like chemotaxis protein
MSGIAIKRPLEGRQIVVVDDDPHQAVALATLLCSEGIVATSECVPAAALARMEADPPDAIVLDVKMPGLSGTELLAGLRAHHPDLPALLLTGYEWYHPQLAVAMASNHVAHFAKPVDLPKLIETLARLVEDREVAPPRASLHV